MSTARLGSWPAPPAPSTSGSSSKLARTQQVLQRSAPVPDGPAAKDPTIGVVEDLVRYARAADLVLADQVLTDILAKLHGWPVEELNRLR